MSYKLVGIAEVSLVAQNKSELLYACSRTKDIQNLLDNFFIQHQMFQIWRRVIEIRLIRLIRGFCLLWYYSTTLINQSTLQLFKIQILVLQNFELDYLQSDRHVFVFKLIQNKSFFGQLANFTLCFYTINVFRFRIEIYAIPCPNRNRIKETVDNL